MDRAGSNVTQEEEEEEEDWRTRQDNKTKEVRARGRSRGTRKQQNHRLARRSTRLRSSAASSFVAARVHGVAGWERAGGLALGAWRCRYRQYCRCLTMSVISTFHYFDTTPLGCSSHFYYYFPEAPGI